MAYFLSFSHFYILLSKSIELFVEVFTIKICWTINLLSDFVEQLIYHQNLLNN